MRILIITYPKNIKKWNFIVTKIRQYILDLDKIKDITLVFIEG